jgi:formylglycine-generating enzyme required for sulfatase activity
VKGCGERGKREERQERIWQREAERAMRVRMLAVMALTLALSVTVSQGEWKMRIHKRGGTVDEHYLAGIDSLTFYDANVPHIVEVPAGVFIMGDGSAHCGVQQHQVTLTQDFYLCQHEVTNQEYLQAVQWAYDHGYVTATATSVRDNLDGSTEELLDLDAENCEIQFDGASFYLRESPSYRAQAAYPEGYEPSDHPVKEVTWYGAVRYCDWLSLQEGLPRAYEFTAVDWACNGGDPYGAQGYRLPTDAEWEYAAQWDDERVFPWGNEQPDCSRANSWVYPHDCVGWTSPVGSYPDAPAALGLSDMAGNVLEWCNDWWVCDLGTNPATDPTGPTGGTYRVSRGGEWSYDGGIFPLRCAYRDMESLPFDSSMRIGFRAARTIVR